MKPVILDGFDDQNAIGAAVKQLLEESGEEVSYFKLKALNILPCRSCGSCGIRTPGKCVLQDDMAEITKAIALGDLILLFTPVRFGGYSSQLKKVIDRTMPMGIPFYFVKDGHLLHPMRYGRKALLGIGMVEQSLEGQEENFRTLVARNALNMQFSQKTLIFKPSDSLMSIQAEIGSSLEEVLKK